MALLAIATLLLNNCLVYSSPISYAGHGAGSDSRGGAIDFSVDDTGSSLHVYREHSPGLTLRKDVVKGSRTPSTTAHDVIFLVKQRNMDELTRILHDISDPKSENYGNHMTSSEIIDLTSNPESHDETVAYLTAAGATIVLVEHAGGSITARAPISLWESMLNTEFFTYSMSIEHAVVHDVEDPTATSFSFVRTEKYSVPIGLDAHVAHVMNTVQLPELRTSKAPPIRYPVDEKAKSSRFSTDSLIIGGYLTPQSIINLYNIDNTTGHPRAIQAAYETVGQAYSPEDTVMFQDVMRIQKRSVIASYGNKSVSAEWCKASGYTICAESNIDLQYMMGLANTPTIHWYTDKPMAWYLFALVYAPKQPPLVISMSYGSEEQYMSVSEYNTFEESAKKLSVMGVTILVAAGDDGAAPHTARNNEANCKYMPMFPTSCPYVISVGATQVYNISATMNMNDYLVVSYKSIYSLILLHQTLLSGRQQWCS
jgi:tripeptidyl-peptidase I